MLGMLIDILLLA